MGKKILGVIPARGGSKGIPRKNLYPLDGKPLIAYTIDAALESKLLTTIVVSTDSAEIAAVARRFKCDPPFVRPAELATDTALSVDVMKHALLQLEASKGLEFDYLVLLQPTTPLRQAADIDGSIRKLISTGCDSVITMVDVGANHPARMYKIREDRLVSIMDEGVTMRPRQELPPVYIRSGDVYACKRNVLFEKNSMIGDDCRPIVIPRGRAVNIDSIEDLTLAKYYLRQK